MNIPISDTPWIDDLAACPVADGVGNLMWRFVGLERSESGLARAEVELDELRRCAPPGRGELDNLLTTARLVMESARTRTESRGAHFRRDVPWSDPHWRQDLYVESGGLVNPRPIAVAG
jgi:aspartate oxidase